MIKHCTHLMIDADDIVHWCELCGAVTVSLIHDSPIIRDPRIVMDLRAAKKRIQELETKVEARDELFLELARVKEILGGL